MSVPPPARISDGAVWIEVNSPGGEVSGLVGVTAPRPRSIFMPTPEQERLRREIEAMIRQVAVATMVDDWLRIDRMMWGQITELLPPPREVEPPPEWATPLLWKRWKP